MQLINFIFFLFLIGIIVLASKEAIIADKLSDMFVDVGIVFFTIAWLFNTVVQNLTFDKYFKQYLFDHKKEVSESEMLPATIQLNLGLYRCMLYMGAVLRIGKTKPTFSLIVNHLSQLPEFIVRVKPINRVAARLMFYALIFVIVVSCVLLVLKHI